jgi:hypothetical protein
MPRDNADTVAVGKFTTEPPGYDQDQYDDCGKHYSESSRPGGRISPTLEKVPRRDKQRRSVAEEVSPGGREGADAAYQKEIDKSEQGGKDTHDDAGREQPKGRSCPKWVCRGQEHEIDSERSDQKCDRERNQHWMDRMSSYCRPAGRRLDGIVHRQALRFARSH